MSLNDSNSSEKPGKQPLQSFDFDTVLQIAVSLQNFLKSADLPEIIALKFMGNFISHVPKSLYIFNN